MPDESPPPESADAVPSRPGAETPHDVTPQSPASVGVRTAEAPHESADLSADELTGQELEEARRHGRIELWCSVADHVLDLIYLAVAAFVLARPLDGWLSRFEPAAEYRMLRLAALYLIVSALHIVVSLPLSFYSGHVVERQFKLSTQGFGGWLWSYLKRQVLAIALALAMVAGLYWVIWHTGAAWWLLGAGAFFVVSVILAELMPVVILPLFYKIEPLDSPELRRRLEELTSGTGLSIEGVYRIGFSAETVKANAMLAGMRRTRRVLLGDTLLDRFSPDEITAICAHELGHHVLGHLHKMALRGLIFSAVVFWTTDRLLCAWLGAWPGVWRGTVDYANLPVWALPFLLLVLSGLMMILAPLHHALSRRAETQADQYALRRTGLKEAYAAAFRKLARLNKDDPDPHWLDILLFHSHPPISRRLALIEKWKDASQAEAPSSTR